MCAYSSYKDALMAKEDKPRALAYEKAMQVLGDMEKMKQTICIENVKKIDAEMRAMCDYALNSILPHWSEMSLYENDVVYRMISLLNDIIDIQ